MEAVAPALPAAPVPEPDEWSIFTSTIPEDEAAAVAPEEEDANEEPPPPSAAFVSFMKGCDEWCWCCCELLAPSLPALLLLLLREPSLAIAFDVEGPPTAPDPSKLVAKRIAPDPFDVLPPLDEDVPAITVVAALLKCTAPVATPTTPPLPPPPPPR